MFRWFCHFDDDNYVNVPALLDLLSKYDHKEDWYLGKPSIKMPIKIPHPDNKSVRGKNVIFPCPVLFC